MNAWARALTLRTPVPQQPDAATVQGRGAAGAPRPRAGCAVLLLVRALHMGGAERQLALLACELKQRGHAVMVLSFYAGGVIEAELLAAGVVVRSLNKRGRWDLWRPLVRLARIVRGAAPQVIYSFMTGGNLLGVLAYWLAPRARLVWGIRASDAHRALPGDRLTRLAVWLETRAAGVPSLIIANSQAGAAVCIAQGFPPARVRVVHNGIDTERFCFDEAGRTRLRADWGVAEEDILLGLVARLDPLKGHGYLIAAAPAILAREPRTKFLIVGRGDPLYAQTLRQQAVRAGVVEQLLWLDEHAAMASVYSALDLLVLPSLSEGFPNVLGEAMACGLRAVVSDVGDNARLLGTAGSVVVAGDAAALAGGALAQIAFGRAAQAASRARIIEHFSVSRMVEQTLAALNLPPPRIDE